MLEVFQMVEIQINSHLSALSDHDKKIISIIEPFDRTTLLDFHGRGHGLRNKNITHVSKLEINFFFKKKSCTICAQAL